MVGIEGLASPRRLMMNHATAVLLCCAKCAVSFFLRAIADVAVAILTVAGGGEGGGEMERQ